ncbi:MAG: alpha-amylase, partial [Muribaculaceae bacterium]|nr:alpha-amylase [Muribaculaceae bacterium]
MKRLHLSNILLLIVMAIVGRDMAHAEFVGGRTDFRDETIYFAMTTRFYDGDPQNNTYCWDGRKNAAQQDPEWRGDFKGLIEKLDYIKALGFTAVWITPVVQNASGMDYHGYHAFDMSQVDKRYESEDCKFQDLIDAAHNKGMKIILDIVINHTGNFGEANLCHLFDRDWTKPQSDITQCMVPYTISQGGLLNNNYMNLPAGQQYQDRLTKMKNTDGVNHDTHNLWHHYGNFNWDEPNRWWAQIAGDCVDLNTENPETYQYLIDCYGSFIKMGVDGFRIDTGGHMSRLTFNKAFLPAFKQLGE